MPQLLIRGDNVILMSRDSDSNYGYSKMRTKLIAAHTAYVIAAKSPNIMKIVRKLEHINKLKKKENEEMLGIAQDFCLSTDIVSDIMTNPNDSGSIMYGIRGASSTSNISSKLYDETDKQHHGIESQSSRRRRENYEQHGYQDPMKKEVDIRGQNADCDNHRLNTVPNISRDVAMHRERDASRERPVYRDVDIPRDIAMHREQDLFMGRTYHPEQNVRIGERHNQDQSYIHYHHCNEDKEHRASADFENLMRRHHDDYDYRRQEKRKFQSTDRHTKKNISAPDSEQNGNREDENKRLRLVEKYERDSNRNNRNNNQSR